MRAARLSRFLAWLGRQAAATALVLLGASLLLFAVARTAPGDAGGHLGFLVAGSEAPEAEAGERSSWPVQYGGWLAGVLQGDFGRSAALQRGRPVGELLLPAAGRSLALALGGVGLSALLGLALAAARTVRPRSRGLSVIAGGVQFVSTLPVFLYVYLAVVAGNGLVAWGAGRGLWTLPAWFPFPARVGPVPWLLATFILAIGDGLLSDLYHRFRTELDQAARGEYLVGVRLLGLSVTAAVARGFLPGAAAYLSRRVAFVLGSLVVLESALGWPGLGYLAWRAAAERDLPVLLGVALVLAAAVRVAVLGAQAVWYLADPRTRPSG